MCKLKDVIFDCCRLFFLELDVFLGKMCIFNAAHAWVFLQGAHVSF